VWEEEKGIYTLVDGYNRFDICKTHKIEYHICIKSFSTRDEVKLWIWDNQEARRNMSPFRRVEGALQLKDVISEQAKEQQRKKKKKDKQEGCPKLDKVKDKEVHTDKILANKAGVSRNTFRNAEAIVKQIAKGKVDKKDIDGLRSGKKKINSIYNKYCAGQAKPRKQSNQNMEERSNSFVNLLKMQVSKYFSSIEDRKLIYKQLSEQLSELAKGIEDDISQQ
jgi:hypothetical protein